MHSKFQYILIEGPIGVGKTSLTRRLCDYLGGELLLEAPEANPFLANFYRDSARYALPTQLFFLFQRANQLRHLAQHDLFRKTIVSDFMLEKDPIFASLTLGDDELSLYQQIYGSLAPKARAADLVIYLQASPGHLIERINRRGNPIEAGISEEYLRELCDAYTRFFYQYDAAPLLMINSEHMNPAENDADFELLVERMSQMRGRREYFNRAA
jgi:deoxyguanosine kinase